MSTDNQASLKLAGWDTPPKSEKYAITLEDEAPASINTQVDAYTFTQTSEEGTFPTTGFTGATFTIVPKDGKKATDYNWTSDASGWVSVTDGVVVFTGTGTGSKVTITGTPTSGQGKIIKYSFTLKSWFINNGNTMLVFPAANTYCSGLSGYSLPTVQQLNGNSSHNNGHRGTLGGLWSEWGRLGAYSGGAGFSGANYWSSVRESNDIHYIVSLNNGYVVSHYDSNTDFVVCRQGL
ncbi:hypothetical protein [Citrobacter freundii]|uniref:hypothetical protein n=1 Tax=Citrobacter freundii TaxID=546 RepID=UPI00300D4384